ncbi:hypothetical protein [Ensifer aridi]|uniref:hypothetical protein n=1 Tax=Ensifer aridi TaxID=1708715 RepID=UPI0009BFCC21|nr:hypothetical protein [Ensifer aridi]
MKKLFFATVLVALSLTGARAAPVNPKYNDSPVQCGATYFLIWKGYEQKNQQAMAEVYRRKFESLAAKAAQNLETRGLSKQVCEVERSDKGLFFPRCEKGPFASVNAQLRMSWREVTAREPGTSLGWILETQVISLV